jgi:hypothetical protein
MKTQVANKRVVARLRGFEPPTSGSGVGRSAVGSRILYWLRKHQLGQFGTIRAGSGEFWATFWATPANSSETATKPASERVCKCYMVHA